MFPIIRLTVFILLVHIASAGFRWIPLSQGDPIPLNAVAISEDENYVGRARHYNEILPAEVNGTHGVVHSCGKIISKYQYEVLVSDSCYWQEFTQFQNVPENIVRGGTTLTGEPIFIARKYFNDGYRNKHHIDSFYMSSKNKNYRWRNGESHNVLLCEDKNNWIDTSAQTIPNNTISGGKSEDGNEIFVARLNSYCSIMPGQVIPKLGFASAVNGETLIQSEYCQVLVGKSNDYRWVMSADGEIPDYAVVGSKIPMGELMYVARINKTIGYIIQSNAAKMNMTYSILVRN